MQKRELKFRYVLVRAGEVQLFDLSLTDCEIESTNFRQFRQLTVFDGWSIIDAIQYTGVRDKNSRAIYEGDIIRFPGDGEICFVEWVIKQAGFFLMRKDGGLMHLAHYSGGIEVIGNIYKNPELVRGVNLQK